MCIKLIIITSLLSLASGLQVDAHEGSIKLFTGQAGSFTASNLPRHCRPNGVMRCHRFHPLFSGGSMKTSLEPRDKSSLKDPVQAGQPLSTSMHGQVIKLNRDGLCLQKGDPGYDQTSTFELYFSVEQCRARSAAGSTDPF
ncbi:MAG: hypothetical protein OEN02_05250 [Gammaproteobacteria bacterium]|nr:hypothetical protein [Gammaproteobacteria bacterium]MDH3536647.1 hypothetical protein [Gammaproteobacteria bacterium]